jgi:SAM-dependent methyltransferase
MKMVKMYETIEARRTLDPKYMTGYLRQAQWAEHIELKKIITELYEKRESPIDVFDIGVGEARVPINLSEIEEIWNCIRIYHGIDIDRDILRTAGKNVRKYNLSGKVKLEFFDARRLSEKLESNERYNSMFCTYFTVGNFVPDYYSFTKRAMLGDLYIKNEFQRVFRPAYDLLQPSGKLILGSVYKDNESTAKRQRGFYKKCGMTVISRPNDPFTATKEGFWSLRFTEKKIRELFDWIDSEKIKFIPLDTYNFAMMVKISK